jgi:UDP-N-acetylmuramyl pentapeptide phosphotransferase/UDP-N-acetylglucosamine-1-phosphate transferase
MPDELLAVILAFLLSASITPLMRHLAIRRGLVDIPNWRSSHSVPTPRLGGVAVLIATLGGAVAAGAASDPRVASLLVASLAIAVLGVADDLRGVPVVVRLLAETIVAALFVLVARPAFALSLPGLEVDIGGLPAAVIAVVWCVGVVNAFNFMDGIDGIAAGVAAVTALLAVPLVAPAAGGVLLAVAAASLGFLVWNHAPSSIFLGDGGSLLLGFALASLVLVPASGGTPAIPVILLFAPFLVETTATILRRLRRRADILASHREHLYQLLADGGRDPRAIAMLYVAAATVTGTGGLLYANAPAAVQMALVVLGIACVAGYIAADRRVRAAALTGRPAK